MKFAINSVDRLHFLMSNCIERCRTGWALVVVCLLVSGFKRGSRPDNSLPTRYYQ